MDRSVSLSHAHHLWAWHVEAEEKAERATSSDWTKGFDAGQGTAYYVSCDLILCGLGLTFTAFAEAIAEAGWEIPPCTCIHCRERLPGRTSAVGASCES